MIINFEGCIGSGKSTLSKMLLKLGDYKLMIEPVESNPLFADYYINKSRNPDFQVELVFLLLHLKQMYEHNKFKNIISDYSFIKSLIFCEANIEDEGERLLYEQVYKKVFPWFILPDVIVYLRGATDKFMSNIKKRSNNDDDGLPYEYLEKINYLYPKYLNPDFCKQYNVSIIEIDMNKYDFVKDSSLIGKLKETTNIAIHNKGKYIVFQ